MSHFRCSSCSGPARILGGQVVCDACMANVENCRCPKLGLTGDYENFVEGAWFSGGRVDLQMPVEVYCCLGIGGESGEILELVKKGFRDSGGTIDDDKLLKELGDLLFYLTKLAVTRGFSLEDVKKANIEKLRGRVARGTMRGSGDDR